LTVVKTLVSGSSPILIVGAGIGGLAAAVTLAAAGENVLILERAPQAGGKIRTEGPHRIDAGPTVFTMRWVFEELFAAAGARLEDALSLAPARILARHAWPDGGRLDLFADVALSADAIGAFAGPREREGFLAFCRAAARTYRTLEAPFIRGALPTPFSLARGAPLPDLLAIRPFATLWSALGEHFRDPRLRQLFGRYATYCGSSPFKAPATLMLVAHVEQAGVWTVEGGMIRLAEALAALATSLGARLRTGSEVAEILTASHGAAGVRLADGERIDAQAVIVNADASAVGAGLLGKALRGLAPVPSNQERSLSALTWTGRAVANGLPLTRHTVCFSPDYPAEFDDLAAGRLPRAPTVYVCAQDRPADDAPPAATPERLLVLVNAPATGARLSTTEMEQCRERTWAALTACGLTLQSGEEWAQTGPPDFARRFPGTEGALYGPAVHGSMATFRRPGSRTRIPGLYLAGGSTHPGAGVPMAALSGRLAASALMADRASTRRSPRTAMSGGTSTR
jgi:1-hydroxycarotenoid 3,4-desaturase